MGTAHGCKLFLEVNMRLAVEMAVMEMDGEWTAVAVGKDSAKFRGMLRLNETAADIVKLLAKETTPEKVLAAMEKKYPDADRNEIGHSIADILNQLSKEGLLKE